MGQKYYCVLEEPTKGVYLELVIYDDDDVHLSVTSYAGRDAIEICLTKDQVKSLIAEFQCHS